MRRVKALRWPRRPSIERSLSKGAGTVCAAKEVISVRKLLFAAILATSALLTLAMTVAADGSIPCCG